MLRYYDNCPNIHSCFASLFGRYQTNKKMMDLAKVWSSRLKVFHYLGLVALEFNPSNSTLSPMSGWKYLRVYLLWLTILFGGMAFSNVYAVNTYPNMTFVQFFTSQRGYISSVTDNMAMNGYVIMTTLTGYLIYYDNFIVTRKLPAYWQFISVMNPVPSWKNNVAKQVSSKSYFWNIR